MRIHRSSGFIAVTMTIAMLALEAVTLMGVVKVASWWNGPRPATLVRAAGTTWSVLSETSTRALVSRAYPVALAALRTTTDLTRAASTLIPATRLDRKAGEREVEVILATARPLAHERHVVRVIRTGHTCKASVEVCRGVVKARVRNAG